MYLFDKTYYILRDITFNRSMAEVVSGVLLVTLATCGLLVVVGLSNGVDKFVSEAMKKARPVIGTVVIKAEKTGTNLSKETVAKLKDWEKNQTMEIGEKSYAIDGISWISEGITNRRYMRFGIETDDEEYKKIHPTIQAIRGDDELLNPDFGISYIDGIDIQHHRFTESASCPVFEVIVNQRFLEKLENKFENLAELTTKNTQFFVTFQQPIGEGFDKKALPPLKLPIAGVIESREAPYPDMFINYWVARAAFLKSPTKVRWHKSYALQFCDAEGNRLLKSLSGAPDDWCTHPGGQLSLSWKDDSGKTILVQDNSSEYQRVGCNIQKELENVRYRKALIWLSDFENADRTRIVKLIHENVTDVTADFHGQSVGKSLKRTAGIIEIFANWAEVGLMMLTIFATMTFGFGHIRRKRQDIGLLKACGLGNKTTATIFLSQIMLVCAMGFIIGLVLVWIGLPLLETEVRSVVQELTNQAVPKDVENLLLISGMTLRDTALFIFFGMLVGSIIPIIQAIKVRPAVGLRTQL